MNVVRFDNKAVALLCSEGFLFSCFCAFDFNFGRSFYDIEKLLGYLMVMAPSCGAFPCGGMAQLFPGISFDDLYEKPALVIKPEVRLCVFHCFSGSLICLQLFLIARD